MALEGDLATNGKYGRAFTYDANFKGPIAERSRTDVQFAVIFGVLFCSWIVFGFWAIVSSRFVQTVSLNYIDGSWGPVPVGLIVLIACTTFVVYLMRWGTDKYIWGFIWLLHAALLLLGYGLIFMHSYFSVLAILWGTSYLRSVAMFFLVSGIISLSMCVFSLFVVCLSRNHIRRSAVLIEAGGRVVNSLWPVILFPIIPALVQALFVIFSWVTFISLAMMFYDSFATLVILQIVNIIMLIWVARFVTAFVEMTLAGMYTAWFWARDKRHISYAHFTESLQRTVHKHLGTVALGALPNPVKFVRYLLAVFSGHTKWCLTQNAYIMAAVHGDGLWHNELRAVQLIGRNQRQYVTSQRCRTWFAFCLSKLAFACTATAVCTMAAAPATMAVFPLIALGMGAYFVADSFLAVYSMAADTLHLCALEDLERNGGSSERSCVMPAQVLDILRN